MNRKRTVVLAILVAASFCFETRGEQPGRTVKIDLHAAPLPSALHQLEAASGLRLAFSDDLVKSAEPVTLSAKNEPVDDVLLKILRPRGMECVYTGEKMAAIVSADSDVGIAKAAGRAIRTLAKLASKLESVRQEGDELLVPAWTDQDNRLLAEAYVELAGTNHHFYALFLRNVTDRGIDARNFDPLLDVLGAWDPNVRLGGAAGAFVFGRAVDMDDAQMQRLNDSLAKMAADPDPLMRGAAVLVSGTLRYRYGRESHPALTRELVKAAADPAPEVRIAVALVCMRHNHVTDWPPQANKSVLPPLRNDPRAIVRAAAYLATHGAHGIAMPDLDAVRPGLHDASPLVRMVCLDHIVRLQNNRAKIVLMNREKPAHAAVIAIVKRDAGNLLDTMKAEGIDQDPWLAAVAQAFLNRSNIYWCKSINAGEKVNPLPEAAEELRCSVNILARMLASPKRSHAMLAVNALIERWRSNWSAVSCDGALFRPITAQAESRYLPARLVGISAFGALDEKEFEPRVLAALDSQDELERIAALWACNRVESGSASPQLEKKLLSLMEGKLPYQAELATRGFGKLVPFDRALAALQDYIRRAPESRATDRLLTAMMWRFPSIQAKSGVDKEMLLLDAVLESRNATLEKSFFFEADNHDWFRENPPVLLAFIADCELQVLREALTPSTHRSPPQQHMEQAFAIDAARERVAQMIRGADGAWNLEAVAALASLLRRVDGLDTKLLKLAEPFLETCFRPGSPDDLIAAGGKLAEELVGKVWTGTGRPGIEMQTPYVWKDLPDAARSAIRAFLGYADRQAHQAQVATVLARCYCRITGNNAPGAVDDEMLKAMEQARQIIMEKAGPAEQAALLNRIIYAGDDAIRIAAVNELQERIIAGKIPPKAREESLDKLWTGEHPLTPQFIRYLFEQIENPGESQRAREQALEALASRPASYELLLPLLDRLVDSGDSPVTYRVLSEITRELRKTTNDKKPLPPWAPAAAELGMKAARATMDTEWAPRAMYGLELYIAVSGPKAADAIESIIQDDKLGTMLRGASVHVLLKANPKTKLFAALAAEYDKLPVDFRDALAIAVSHRNPGNFNQKDIPGAAELLARYLRDPEMFSFEVRETIRRLDLPLAPELLAVVKELQNDPEFEADAKDAIKRDNDWRENQGR